MGIFVESLNDNLYNNCSITLLFLSYRLAYSHWGQNQKVEVLAGAAILKREGGRINFQTVLNELLQSFYKISVFCSFRSLRTGHFFRYFQVHGRLLFDPVRVCHDLLQLRHQPERHPVPLHRSISHHRLCLMLWND